MFINQNIVAVIFKLINFFTLIGLVLFLFKKYVKADVLFAIEQKKADHEALLRQQISLENQQRNLDEQVQSESIQCQDFKSKIDEWKRIVIFEQDTHEKNLDVILSAAKQRRTEIARKQENQRIQNHIIDAVTNDLKKSLSHDFSHSKKGNDYLDAIVRFMNEKIS